MDYPRPYFSAQAECNSTGPRMSINDNNSSDYNAIAYAPNTPQSMLRHASKQLRVISGCGFHLFLYFCCLRVLHAGTFSLLMRITRVLFSPGRYEPVHCTIRSTSGTVRHDVCTLRHYRRNRRTAR